MLRSSLLRGANFLRAVIETQYEAQGLHLYFYKKSSSQLNGIFTADGFKRIIESKPFT